MVSLQHASNFANSTQYVLNIEDKLHVYYNLIKVETIKKSYFKIMNVWKYLKTKKHVITNKRT